MPITVTMIAFFWIPGLNNIPGIEEVIIRVSESMELVIDKAKVEASISANTYVITGTAEVNACSIEFS